MAYLIFNDISELKTYIGGGANLSLEMDSLAGSLHDAARDHLVPWLGRAQWDALVDAVENDDASTEENALLPYVRRPLAHLTMHEYSKVGGIQFGEAGIFRTESETHKAAYKYQENQYRDYMLEKGWEAIEEMLAFLEANEEDYNPWYASTAYERNKSLLINTAADFRESYSAYVGRYTFELLRPLIEDLEAFAIRPLLGDGQLDAIKAAILAKNLTAAQSALLKVLQKAVANFTMREGMKRLLVRIEGTKVVQSERLEPQSYEKAAPPSANALSLPLLQQDAWGNRYISYILKHLTDHIEDFPLFAAHLEEQAAAASAADGCHQICLEGGTGNWQLENAPGALNTSDEFDRGACPANCSCGKCTGSGAAKPAFRL